MSAEDTLGATEAAAILHADAETVMQFARRGDLPGTRIGKSWVFLREDVMAFLRNQIATDTEERRRHHARAHVAVVEPIPKHRGRKPLPQLPPIPKKLTD